MQTIHDGNLESKYIGQSKSQTFTWNHNISSFFTQSVSARELMLHVYGGNIYLRNDRRAEWLQCFTLDSPILTLYSIDTEENCEKETRFICVTETTINLLSLNQDKKQIIREKFLTFPGKAIRTKLSSQTWGNSKLLIMTAQKEKLE